MRTLPCGTNWTSLLWTTPSTSGGVVCRPVSTLKADIWTLLMIATLKITMSKWQHCKFDNWRWLFLFSFAVNVNEQRIIAFLTEKCCYLNLRSKVRTQGNVVNFTTVACRISSQLEWYENYKNRLRLAKVMVKNKMSLCLWFTVYVCVLVPTGRCLICIHREF